MAAVEWQEEVGQCEVEGQSEEGREEEGADEGGVGHRGVRACWGGYREEQGEMVAIAGDG